MYKRQGYNGQPQPSPSQPSNPALVAVQDERNNLIAQVQFLKQQLAEQGQQPITAGKSATSELQIADYERIKVLVASLHTSQRALE